MPSRGETNILWQRLDAPGWEHLRLLSQADRPLADGLVVSAENELGEYTYQGLDGREYRVAVDAEGLVTDYEDVFKRIWLSR